MKLSKTFAIAVAALAAALAAALLMSIGAGVAAAHVLAALSGPHAPLLAAPLLVGSGVALASGRLTWGIAGSVIFGIVLVFGSAQIVQFFQSAVGGTSGGGTGGTLAPVQSTLTTLVAALTGPIATALATLAVIACGFFAWSGRLTTRAA